MVSSAIQAPGSGRFIVDSAERALQRTTQPLRKSSFPCLISRKVTCPSNASVVKLMPEDPCKSLPFYLSPSVSPWENRIEGHSGLVNDLKFNRSSDRLRFRLPELYGAANQPAFGCGLGWGEVFLERKSDGSGAYFTSRLPFDVSKRPIYLTGIEIRLFFHNNAGPPWSCIRTGNGT